MNVLRILIRLALSIVVGWPLAFAPVLVTEPLGIMHGWGYAHSGLILLAYPLAVWLVFVLLGRIPGLKTRKSAASGE